MRKEIKKKERILKKKKVWTIKEKGERNDRISEREEQVGWKKNHEWNSSCKKEKSSLKNNCFFNNEKFREEKQL